MDARAAAAGSISAGAALREMLNGTRFAGSHQLDVFDTNANSVCVGYNTKGLPLNECPR